MEAVSELALSPEAVARAEILRARIRAAEAEVDGVQRKRARPIKVGFGLSGRCDVPGIEGRLVAVSVTGAIITVRDAASRQDIEIPNVEVISMDLD